VTSPTQNALHAYNYWKHAQYESADYDNTPDMAQKFLLDYGETIRQSLQTLEALMPLVEELVSVREKATEGEWYVGSRHSITADKPAIPSTSSYKGFDDPMYDGRYLLAENVVQYSNTQFIATAANISNKIKEVLGGL